MLIHRDDSSPPPSCPLPLHTHAYVHVRSQKRQKKQRKNEKENEIKKAHSLFSFYSELDEKRDSSQLDLDSRVEKCERRRIGEREWTWVRTCHARAGLLPPRGREILLLLSLFAVELRYHQYTSAFFFFLIDKGSENA